MSYNSFCCIFHTLIVCIFFFLSSISSILSQCVNGDAELNTFQGWYGGNSVRTMNGISLNSMINGINSNYHKITSSGYDPNVGGNLLSMVGEGGHGFQLGNHAADTHGDRLYYTFTVTNSNANFSFMYAMVLEDGDHNLSENPFFMYSVILGNNPNFLSNTIHAKTFMADVNDPFFKKSGRIVWKDWSRECINLTKYIGKTVTIVFYAADCAHGGHFGYAYIDGLCTDPTPVPSFTLSNEICIADSLIMDATNTSNEDSYFLSVQESNQWWNSIGQEYTQWFVAQQAGIIDIKSFLISKGGSLKCNTYYRVKLAVSNKCVPWVEKTKLIFVKCPQMHSIADIVRCCDDESSNVVVLGPATNDPTNHVYWQPSGGVSFTPYQPILNNYAIFNHNSNGYVDVTVMSESENCYNSQRVHFLTIPDFDVQIEATKFNCCETRLTAKIIFDEKCSEKLTEDQKQLMISKLNFSWNTGETTNSVIASGASKEYKVTVTSPLNCYSKVTSHQYQQSPLYIGNTEYPVVLSAPNALISGSSGNNGKLIIIASYNDSQGPLFPAIGTHQGIYRAKELRIIVWNRWGQQIFQRDFSDCGTLYQGDVYWDGKDNNGNFVQPGTYTYKIYTKICGASNFRPYCNANHKLNTSACLKWCYKPFWPFGKYCCDEYTPGDCAYVINVIK